MRNLPLFLFLIGLVVFFYVFYVYQAKSTLLSQTEEQLDLQVRQQKVLRNEIVDLKADMEKVRASESSLRDTESATKIKLDECTTSLRSIKLRSDSLTSEKTAVETAKQESEKELTDAKDKLAALEQTQSTLQLGYDNQAKLIVQLNNTVNALESELLRLKSAGGVVAAQPTVVPAVLPGAPLPVIPEAKVVTVAAAPADKKVESLGDLIKEEKAEEAVAAVKVIEEKKDEDNVDVDPNAADNENGEKADGANAHGDKQDELKGVEVKEEADGEAREDKEVVKGEQAEGEDKDSLPIPAHPGDRVKMEEGLMEADKKDDDNVVKPPPHGAIQGGEYVDKDDADDKADDDAAAIDAPEGKQ